MTLKKIVLKAGVNKENTRYANENGWYECDKIRFRQGTPEKIGGWQRISANTFLGVCRSLWNWITLDGTNLIGIGTNIKFYVSSGGNYYDITPIVSTVALTVNPLSTQFGLPTVNVYAPAHGAQTGDYVILPSTGTVTIGGLTLSGEYVVTAVDANNYTITASANATSTVVAGGGSFSVSYELEVAPEIQQPISGWGGGGWGGETAGLPDTGWGYGTTSSTVTTLRLWSQTNFGQDLIFGPRGGDIYYWDANLGYTSRAVSLSSLGDAGTPTLQNYILVSDTSRFVFAFGANPYDADTATLGAQNPMLIRWSGQEDAQTWIPSATNQAGDLTLSHGSEIIAAIQTRQEIVVFTDSSVYSLQYLGPPVVWGSQLLGDNISIQSENAVALASGVVYWMGVDKFYAYDGRVQTLNCDLRKFVFSDLNQGQNQQIFAGTNEGFNEVWWFYCSITGPDGTGTTNDPNTTIDRYVVYNYVEKCWYYGTIARTAWLDSGLLPNPLGATYNNNIVYHEYGLNDYETATPAPIYSYIASAEFDIDDGDKFGFVWRMLPDITFSGSTANSPVATLTLIPMQNSGSGYNSPRSVGGSDNAQVVRTATVPIEKFTGQVYVRVRGRQMILKVENEQLDTSWQLGFPRIDIRQDGRR